VCCLVGAASISAFPLFSGFVSKSLILDASVSNGYYLVWFALVVASAGVLSHSGIKIPYFTFFAHDSGKRPAEAPLHMRVAMIMTAFLCVFIGVFPGTLYALLPYAVDYKPYTVSHVLAQMQLLCFALLAFVFLMRKGLHPPEVRGINLDSDWVYRKLAPRMLPFVVGAVGSGVTRLLTAIKSTVVSITQRISGFARPGSILAVSWGVNSMVLIVTVMMLIVLVFNLA